MSEDSNKLGGNILAQAWLVILLALLYGVGLAGVHIWLNPKILEERAKKIQRNVPELLQGALAEKTAELRLEGPDGKVVTVLKGIGAEGQTIGWLIPASGPGYNEPIEIVVGLNADASQMTGIAILAQKETPGLGDRISEKEFQNHFANVATDHWIELAKGEKTKPYEISSITGATVSSQSVTDIVNKVIRHYKPLIQHQNESN